MIVRMFSVKVSERISEKRNLQKFLLLILLRWFTPGVFT